MNQRIGLGQLRNSAAYYLDRVAEGESFDVVRRGRMVAKIVPLDDVFRGGLGDQDVDVDGEAELPQDASKSIRPQQVTATDSRRRW